MLLLFPKESNAQGDMWANPPFHLVIIRTPKEHWFTAIGLPTRFNDFPTDFMVFNIRVVMLAYLQEIIVILFLPGEPLIATVDFIYNNMYWWYAFNSFYYIFISVPNYVKKLINMFTKQINVFLWSKSWEEKYVLKLCPSLIPHYPFQHLFPLHRMQFNSIWHDIIVEELKITLPAYTHDSSCSFALNKEPIKSLHYIRAFFL